MKKIGNDKMILGAAVLFAAVLVAQKTGVLNKLQKAVAPRQALPSLSGFQKATTPFYADTREGYDYADPGQFVVLDDLIIGATDNDWQYIPTFDQSVDAVLGGSGYGNGPLVGKPIWAP